MRQVAGQQAHHRAPGRVERARGRVLQTGVQRAGRRGADLLRCRHRLDPGDVRAAVAQAAGQLLERFNGHIAGERAERLEQLAGRPDRTRDDHRPRRRIRHLAGDLRSTLGQLVDPILGAMQLQALAVAAERVGQDDVGDGVDELLMEGAHLLRMIGVPELGRIAGA